MKITQSILALGVSAILFSCSGNKPAENVESTETAMEDVAEKTLTIDPTSTKIRWEGGTSGVQIYSHFGSISAKEGTVMMKGDQLTGGNLVIDMNTISPEDANYGEEHPKEHLVEHLTTEEFFLVETYPTASFKVTSVNGNEITGDLTIRDKTNSEKGTIENVTIAEDGTATVTINFSFDRQKYGVSWAHYLKDVLLKDKIDLKLTIVAK